LEVREARAACLNAERGARPRDHGHWPLALSIVLIFALCSFPVPRTAYAQGWLIGYDKRVKLTIDYNDVTSTLSMDIVWGKVKIVAFSRGSLSAAYSDGGSASLGTSEISINTLTTTFSSGAEVAVMASEQFDGTHNSQTRTINAGNNKLQQNLQSTGQAVNEYAITIPPNSDNDDGKGFGLLNKYTNVPASPEYEVRASATGSASGESKILALCKPPKVPEFPLGPTLALAVCFTVLLTVRRWKRTA